VIVKTKKEEKAVNVWHKINEEIGKLLEQGKIKTPFNILPESLSHVEEQLDKKRSFYTDLIKDGVLLFSNGKIKLELREGELSLKEKKAIAKEDFDLWFKQAKTSFEHYNFGFNKSPEKREYLSYYSAVSGTKGLPFMAS